jgi:hypothetical protein
MEIRNRLIISEEELLSKDNELTLLRNNNEQQ